MYTTFIDTWLFCATVHHWNMLCLLFLRWVHGVRIVMAPYAYPLSCWAPVRHLVFGAAAGILRGLIVLAAFRLCWQTLCSAQVNCYAQPYQMACLIQDLFVPHSLLACSLIGVWLDHANLFPLACGKSNNKTRGIRPARSTPDPVIVERLRVATRTNHHSRTHQRTNERLAGVHRHQPNTTPS